MTEKFWTVEVKEDLKKLQAARTARREYMRKYMQKNRKLGKIKHWQSAGCEVLTCESSDPHSIIALLLDELGRRRMTNVLVEGGAGVLGSFFDAGAVDEVHAFIAPKIVGGKAALSPIHGEGIADMADARRLSHITVQQVGDDIYLQGRVNHGR